MKMRDEEFDGEDRSDMSDDQAHEMDEDEEFDFRFRREAGNQVSNRMADDVPAIKVNSFDIDTTT
jgi:hypothetical protein